METKKLFRCALVIAMMFLLCYLIGAFIAASFNIAEWSDGTRAGIAIFGGIPSMLIGFGSAGYIRNDLP